MARGSRPQGRFVTPNRRGGGWLGCFQAQLTAVEAEGAAADVAVAGLTAQLKEARRHAEEEAQAAEARREAEAAARRSLGLMVRLRAAWRGE
jgi:hypothetical protein